MESYIKTYLKSIILIAISFFAVIQINAQSQTFTSSDPTWTVPAGATSITVECWGAGGGGASITNGTGGGGGGGGAYASSVITVSGGEPFPVVVGVGGGPGVNGGFSSAAGVIAAGGAGVATDSNTGGAGGSGSTGTITFDGGTGGTGLTSGSDNAGGGGGGAGSAGSGGNGGTPTAGTGTAVNGGDGGAGGGNNGLIYGGGGGGSKRNGTGGSGANGLVIITWTIPVASDCPDGTSVAPAGPQSGCPGFGVGTLTATESSTGGSGTYTPIYQWYYNDAIDSNDPNHASATPIGGNSATYNPPTSAAEEGDRWYFCVAYATDNTCGQSATDQILASNAVQITVNPPAPVQPDPISGLTTVSPSTGDLVYSVTPVAHADVDGYVWTIPTGWSGTSTSNSITLTSGTAGQDGDITVTASNSCGTSPPQTLAITVLANNCPASTSVAPGGAQTKCVGDGVDLLTATISTSGGSGTPTPSYQWYYNTSNSNNVGTATLVGGATSSTYTPLTTASEIGDRWYFCVGYATDNGCGQDGTEQSLASNAILVTVNTVPALPTISGPTTVPSETPGQTYNIPSVPDATNYTWTIPGTPGAWSDLSGQGTNQITATSGTQGGDITVNVTNACGDGPTASLTVSIGASPDCPSSTTVAPGGIQTVCEDVTTSQLTASISTSGGSGAPTLSYQWYYNTSNSNTVAGATTVAGAISQNYTPLSTSAEVGDRYYFCVGYAPDNGCAQTDATQSLASNAVQITVDPKPGTPTPISGNTNVAASTGGLVYSTTSTNADANGYTWTIPVGWTGTSTINSITLTSGLDGQNGNITVTASNSCGSSSTTILAVSVGALTDHSTYGCNACHIFHNGTGSTLTNFATNALLCQSCHVSGGNASLKPLLDSDRASDTGNRNSHSWAVNAVNAAMETVVPSNTDMSTRLDASGNIICSTCHNQHNSAAPLYLRADNTDDAMCKDCHSSRNRGKYTDAPATNKGTHPVGVIYDDTDTRFENTQTLVANGNSVQCSTCHGIHDVDGSNSLTTDGNLLRLDNTASALCTDCHVPMTHNGFSCGVCHDTHNPDKTNIYMIKSNITVTTPAPASASINADVVHINSTDFGDQTGTVDGICEVCHTTTSYYNNTNTGTSHNPGADCVSCHKHGDSFAGGSCIGCHSELQGSRRIVAGASGDFVKTSHHLTNTTDDADCVICHDQSGHQGGTVNLNDADGGTSYAYNPGTPETINDFCLNCHDADGANGDFTPFTDNVDVTTLSLNRTGWLSSLHQTHAAVGSCLSCHGNGHGSDNNKLLLVAGDIEAVCKSCHTAGQSASAYSIDAWNSGLNSHAWAVAAVNGTYDAGTPTGTMSTRLDGSNIVCSTCHDPHDNTNLKLLADDNSADGMCKNCHSVRDVGTYATDNTNHKGSHPVGLTIPAGDYTSPTLVSLVNSKVECSTCHGVHNTSTSDGSLLNVTNDNTLCRDCHTVGLTEPTGTGPDGTHNSMTCIDCHVVHNTDKGNIYMIRSDIGGSPVVHTNSTDFADGDATYNGICEVCHTGAIGPLTDYHRADGTGATHNPGTDCIDCHTHETNFAPGGSCIDCHSTAQDDGDGNPVGGRPAVVPDFSLTSTHTAGAVTEANCKSCHYNGGTAHMNDVVSLLNVDDGQEWVADKDDFCLQCHDGGAPTNIVDYSYINVAPYDKSNYSVNANKHEVTATNSCSLCHNGHGSSNANLLEIAGNYAVCNSCHTSGQSASTLSTDSWTSGTNSHAWNAAAINGTYEAVEPSEPMLSRLEGGNIVCSTCHDVHDNSNLKNLADDNTADGMCKDCHSARNVGTFLATSDKGSHPVGVSIPGTADYSTPAAVSLLGGNVECSTCHSAHNPTTSDGNLLKMTNDVNLCKECHNYQPHFGGMDCLDCHYAHDNTKSNIYMIRDDIGTGVVFTGDATFADGTGSLDGICEVCHTTTAHHTGNTDDGHNHNDGTDCTGCHAHNDGTNSFPNSSCHSCHLTPTYEYPATGAHATHIEKMGYGCDECHNGLDNNSPGHNNGTKDIVFKPGGLAFPFGADAGLTPTYNTITKTCDNIYCHSDGRNAYVGQRGAEKWSKTLGSQSGIFASPVWTGSITGCTSCHNGTGNMNSPYTITTPGLANAGPPESGKHTSSAHLSNSQELSGNGWAGVQCFWCHNTNSGEHGSPMNQGTYNTSLHVDGVTHFDPRSVRDGGTMLNTDASTSFSYSKLGSAAHCGAGKQCW